MQIITSYIEALQHDSASLQHFVHEVYMLCLLMVLNMQICVS